MVAVAQSTARSLLTAGWAWAPGGVNVAGRGRRARAMMVVATAKCARVLYDMKMASATSRVGEARGDSSWAGEAKWCVFSGRSGRADGRRARRYLF